MSRTQVSVSGSLAVNGVSSGVMMPAWLTITEFTPAGQCVAALSKHLCAGCSWRSPFCVWPDAPAASLLLPAGLLGAVFGAHHVLCDWFNELWICASIESLHQLVHESHFSAKQTHSGPAAKAWLCWVYFQRVRVRLRGGTIFLLMEKNKDWKIAQLSGKTDRGEWDWDLPSFLHAGSRLGKGWFSLVCKQLLNVMWMPEVEHHGYLLLTELLLSNLPSNPSHRLRRGHRGWGGSWCPRWLCKRGSRMGWLLCWPQSH